ncbi:hypothetical protein Athai_04780 [Actinocatenispora thailandica]|uniref:GH26 domain-containing protein n=1 Tax=Actinocatenispora thailandica TaxID=227318 RepID=A0A7R7DK34_9ACTN|nr:hypothetical protein [Actinocatenispora thailandica]BCJ32975.1 hypothetical protein Athai_04780 [Actinocatenispora thailandica]
MRRRTATVLIVVAVGAVLTIGLGGYGLLSPEAGNAVRPVPIASEPTPTDTGPSDCTLGAKLVPTCHVLWGAATGGHTGSSLTASLREFEQKTQRTQAVFHTYHRGLGTLFPTAEEIATADEAGHPRIPFINWKPAAASWADIAAGDPQVDDFIDRLAAHIAKRFPGPFFLTIHHEPENDVRPAQGSGYTAADYAAMYRHVVQRLRDDGATNVVTVMTYMGYPKWPAQPWFDQLFPGDDVVDWIALDVYAYSTPGYGYGDFGEMVNRGGDGSSPPPSPSPSPTSGTPSPSPSQSPSPSGSAASPSPSPSTAAPSSPPPSSAAPAPSGTASSGLPSAGPRDAGAGRRDGFAGFYNWAATRFPDKPLMIGEWGVWSGTDAKHKAWFFDNVGAEIARYPRIRALLYFETPHDNGRDSRVDRPAAALPAYRKLGALPIFQVTVPAASPPALPTAPPTFPSAGPVPPVEPPSRR